MRTWLAWVSVLAMCAFSPALAQGREKGRDRGDDGKGHSAAQRHPDAGRHSSRGSSRDGGAGRGAYQRSDPGARGAWHPRADDRQSRHEAAPAPPRYSTGRDASRGDTSRPADGRYSRHENGGNWRRSDGYRHDDHGWRGSHRDGGYRGRAYGYRRAYPYYAYRPYYRHGYFYGHGYYFPRYYFDIEAYPAYGSIRTLVGPDQTEVYVDGNYAGVADDFDGLFQRLRVAPGPHEVTLRLDGFLTWSAQVFAAPGQTIDLHHDMVPGASEPGPGYGPDSGYGPGPGYEQRPGVDGPPDGDVPPGEYGQPDGDEPPPGAYEDSGPPPQN